ncbi:hypothetical protein F4703DRAFT_1934176 [Phycomyces blakesleeanus]
MEESSIRKRGSSLAEKYKILKKRVRQSEEESVIISNKLQKARKKVACLALERTLILEQLEKYHPQPFESDSDSEILDTDIAWIKPQSPSLFATKESLDLNEELIEKPRDKPHYTEQIDALCVAETAHEELNNMYPLSHITPVTCSDKDGLDNNGPQRSSSMCMSTLTSPWVHEQTYFPVHTYPAPHQTMPSPRK